MQWLRRKHSDIVHKEAYDVHVAGGGHEARTTWQRKMTPHRLACNAALREVGDVDLELMEFHRDECALPIRKKNLTTLPANTCRKVRRLACSTRSRLGDKFYGQWMVQNVPFRRFSDPIPGEAFAELKQYHSWNNFQRLSAEHGVVVFVLGEHAPAPTQMRLAPRQQRAFDKAWDCISLALDHSRAATEQERDEARERAWDTGKIQVVDGPPGTGKTFVLHLMIQKTLEQGGTVAVHVLACQPLWSSQGPLRGQDRRRHLSRCLR